MKQGGGKRLRTADFEWESRHRLVGGFNPARQLRIVRAVQKRKWFQVTRSRSPTPRRHATAQSFAARITGRLSLRLPAAFFRTRRINASRLTCQLSWLEPASRSGLSLSRNDCPSPGHHFEVKAPDLLLRHPTVRSSVPVRIPIPSRRSGSPRHARDHYRNPVARLPSGTPNPSSDLHSPSGPFGPLRIKAFNPIPGREVHLPSAPDGPSLPGIDSILLVPMPDHRSRLAKRSVACCSSDLLEPQSSCTLRDVTVK